MSSIDGMSADEILRTIKASGKGGAPDPAVRKLEPNDLRALGLLDELPGSGRILLEEMRVKDVSELPQVRRESLIRHFQLGGHKGKIVVDGEALDLDKAEELPG